MVGRGQLILHRIVGESDSRHGPLREVVPLGVSYDVGFVPGGELLVCVGRRVSLKSLARGRTLAVSKGIYRPGYVAVSPSGDNALVKSTTGLVTLLDIPSMRTVAVLGGEEYGEGPGPVFVDEHLFLEGSWGGAVLVRRVDDGSVVWSELDSTRRVLGIASSPDRSTFAWGVVQPERASVTIRRWPFDKHEDASVSAGTDPIALDCRGRLAEASGERIQVWDITSGNSLRHAKISRPHYDYDVAWNPAGGLALTGKDCVWGLDETLSVLWEVELPYACSVAFSGDGHAIALGAWEHGIAGRLL
jgi:WD40 repeat protein